MQFRTLQSATSSTLLILVPHSCRLKGWRTAEWRSLIASERPSTSRPNQCALGVQSKSIPSRSSLLDSFTKPACWANRSLRLKWEGAGAITRWGPKEEHEKFFWWASRRSRRNCSGWLQGGAGEIVLVGSKEEQEELFWWDSRRSRRNQSGWLEEGAGEIWWASRRSRRSQSV